MKTKTSRAGDKKLDDDTIRRLAYARNYQETLDFFNVTLEKGLSDAQVQAQAAKFGPNELDKVFAKITRNMEMCIIFVFRRKASPCWLLYWSSSTI